MRVSEDAGCEAVVITDGVALEVGTPRRSRGSILSSPNKPDQLS